MRRRLALLLTGLALAVPGAAAAQCPQTSLGDVEDEVMCPVCGTPLELATEAPQAERQRELIRRLVADCRSKEEIKTTLVDELGENVLALPGGDGFDLAAYVVPGLALLVAAGALGAAAVQWRRTRSREDTTAPPGPGTAASDRLQNDLERYDL